MKGTYWYAVDYAGTGHLLPTSPKGMRGSGTGRKPCRFPKGHSGRYSPRSPGRTHP